MGRISSDVIMWPAISWSEFVSVVGRETHFFPLAAQILIRLPVEVVSPNKGDQNFKSYLRRKAFYGYII